MGFVNRLSRFRTGGEAKTRRMVVVAVTASRRNLVSHRFRRTLLPWLMIVPLLVHAADGCKLTRLVSVPITMDGLRPTVEAQINGSPALFMLDSGAFWSMLTPAAAKQYHVALGLQPHPRNVDPGSWRQHQCRGYLGEELHAR